MPTHLRTYWRLLRESLWFIPGLLVLTSFSMTYGLVEFDAHTSWNGARAMLAAIAGSLLTVATLAFLLTLSTISQISSQYSPRVLRNFMRDRVNQVAMGYFVGVFAYCLIVLGTIRGTDEIKFVPSSAVLVGLMLALGGGAALTNDYIRLAFDLVRINAKGNHAVVRRMLRALALVVDAACADDRKPILRQQVDWLMDSAEQTLTTDYQKAQVRELHKSLAEHWA